jgi:hypothetical protein
MHLAAAGATLNAAASYKFQKCGSHAPPVYGFDTFTGGFREACLSVCHSRVGPRRAVDGVCTALPYAHVQVRLDA